MKTKLGVKPSQTSLYVPWKKPWKRNIGSEKQKNKEIKKMSNKFGSLQEYHLNDERA